MKALVLAALFLLVLILGTAMETYSQARSSVRYTIVITEDMLASNSQTSSSENSIRSGHQVVGGFDEAARDEFKPSVLSVSVHTDDRNLQDREALLFGSEIDYAYFPAFLDVLNNQLGTDDEHSIEKDETIRSSESGGFRVVVEYN